MVYSGAGAAGSGATVSGAAESRAPATIWRFRSRTRLARSGLPRRGGIEKHSLCVPHDFCFDGRFRRRYPANERLFGGATGERASGVNTDGIVCGWPGERSVLDIDRDV
jgi:hypothetical protein